MTAKEQLAAVQAVIDAAQIAQRQRAMNDETYVRWVDKWVRSLDAKKAKAEN